MDDIKEEKIMGLDEVEQQNTIIDDIDAENVNLIFLAIDCSGSMYNYTDDMKKSLNDFKDSLINSKEKDEILVSRVNFNDKIDVKGYKKIDDFDVQYDANDQTRLYDVIIEGKEKLTEYMNYLKNEGMRTKAVFAIFTDGEDVCSRNNLSDAKQAINELNQKEITTAMISFGSESKNIGKSLNIKNILSVGSSSSELRKAFNCLSKSVIESSKSVVPDDDDFFNM